MIQSLPVPALPHAALTALHISNADSGEGLGEGSGTILIFKFSSIFCSVFFCQLLNELGMFNSQFDSLFLGILKNLSESRCHCIVHVNNGMFCSCIKIDGASDQVFSSRSQNLFNKSSAKVKILSSLFGPGSKHHLGFPYFPQDHHKLVKILLPVKRNLSSPSQILPANTHINNN